jgi:hypothetical protein
MLFPFPSLPPLSVNVQTHCATYCVSLFVYCVRSLDNATAGHPTAVTLARCGGCTKTGTTPVGLSVGDLQLRLFTSILPYRILPVIFWYCRDICRIAVVYRQPCRFKSKADERFRRLPHDTKWYRRVFVKLMPCFIQYILTFNPVLLTCLSLRATLPQQGLASSNCPCCAAGYLLLIYPLKDKRKREREGREK